MEAPPILTRKGRAKAFAEEWRIPKWTTDMEEAIYDPETDVVVVGIPNHMHKKAVLMAAAAGQGGYVAEKAESETGWIFPVGDEVHELGYTHMFMDMFNAMDTGRDPMETFTDGYVVNAIIDACYRSAQTKKWEPLDLDVGSDDEGVEPEAAKLTPEGDPCTLIKKERMPDGRTKLILKEKATGKIFQRIMEKG
ncbi:MAG: hypothetical protein GQ544_07255 [Candidatus Aminicenantes bacterium]|nr:hypothetical protein [Candidatus Aminicenantes bacterium]